MPDWFRSPRPATRRLLRTRPAAMPLLACLGGGLLSALAGLVGATIAAGAAIDLVAGGMSAGLSESGLAAPAAGAEARASGGAWAALATGMAICVVSGGAMLSFVAAGVPHEIALDVDTGDVLVRRHPLRELRIPRRRLRHVRVTGASNRSGRPSIVVRLAARGRRVPLLVDGGSDLEVLRSRVLGHARGLAEALGVPLVLEGWARDPGRRPGTGERADGPPGWD